MINNVEISKQPKNKSRNFILMLCLGVMILGFLATKYFSDEKKYQLAKKSSQSDGLSNIDSQINKKSVTENITAKLSEDDFYPGSTLEGQKPLREIYANLMKQQLLVEALQEKYLTLKNEIEKIRNQDKLSKIIISFTEVKDCIASAQNCDAKLQKLELLAKSDSILSSKIANLKSSLQNNPKSLEQIKSQFTALIPSIIVAEPLVTSQNYFDKIKYNLAKLIVIRRVDGIVGGASQNIDFVIVETEKLINQNKFQEALNLLSAQNEIYKPILSEFIADLQKINQLDKATDEIFSYLKSI